MLRDMGTVRLGHGRVDSATQQHSPRSAQLRPAQGCLMLAERETELSMSSAECGRSGDERLQARDHAGACPSPSGL